MNDMSGNAYVNSGTIDQPNPTTDTNAIVVLAGQYVILDDISLLDSIVFKAVSGGPFTGQIVWTVW